MLDKLFRSRLRAKLLAWLLSHPDERYFVRQLQSLLQEDATNLSRELSRLADMGILTRKVEGRQKYYQADSQCPVFRDLQGLVVKTSGVADVLRSALAPLGRRIRVGFVYGSIARGELSAASDVDVVVVGSVSFRAVVSALSRSQDKLGREVNPIVYTPKEFRQKLAAGHHFLTAVLKGPKMFLIGGERELAGLAEKRLVDETPDKP